ncbi:unnamed protein product [Bemisia tabaci]|uniref:Protein FAM122A n=1 Tax=Bemisia tabaci TaxID=7038 RepID=A0A9P0AER7_BEMTA|nr:PREDICTED: protein FAM122A [Bemisia tabaci]CAH0389014.1 unnamed protein product [Bemisia tabaci]
MAGNLSSFVQKMDIDNPGNLKRSNSAPMINEINARSVATTASTSNTTSRSSSPCNIFACTTVQSRTRRFSASFSPHHTPASSPRLTPRVSQLRQEECVDREAAHEKELHSAMVMSQSWEDLTVDPSSKSEDGSKSVRMLDPLHVSLPCGPPLCSSPSPTRSLTTRQCFSPSISMWKTSLSPSPTRKAFCTRSLSPVAMRPSSLGSVKRKFELDDNEPPAKRGGLLIAQSRLEVNSLSPLPGSLPSIGTPESVSSADSPGGFTFRPVDTPAASPLPSPQQSTPRPPPPPPDHPMQDLTKNTS